MFALGCLGAGLARVVSGHHLRWIVALVAMGAIVAAIGTELNIA